MLEGVYGGGGGSREIMNFERNLLGLYRQTYICLKKKKEACKALIDP